MEKLKKELADLESRIREGEFSPVYGPKHRMRSPNQIRAAVRKYQAENTITQLELAHRIGVLPGSFSKFMTQHYMNEWSALDNNVYWEAAKFLAVEEIKGKMAALEAKKRGVTEMSGGEGAANAADPKRAKLQAADMKLQQITSVALPAHVPVYATCDEIRSALNRFFATSGATEAQWLHCVDAPAKSLNNFRQMSGAGAGGANQIYWKAYRFFEQKRILENKPKSAKRLEYERIYGQRGFPLSHDNGIRYTFSLSHH